MNAKNMLAVVVAFAATAVLAAGPWYVAKEDPNAADTLVEGRGTEALPFRTIQAALDNAAFEAGDTVYVKPGVYDEGMKKDNFSHSMTNRVFISKPVHLKAIGKKSDTVIAGHISEQDPVTGCGTNSIRCVGIAADATGTTIEGFTFRNGRSTDISNKINRAYRKGGGIYYDGTDKGVTVVDCDFIDCRAPSGGAACRIVAIRCLVDSCNGWNGAAFDGCHLFSCVVVGCWRLNDTESSYQGVISATSGDTIVVNTTFLLNSEYLFQAEGKFGTNSFEVYNCVLAGNEARYKSPEDDRAATVSNSTKTATSAEGRFQVFSPGLGDFRLVSNATAIGLGLASWTNRLVEARVDPKYLTRDFLGAEIVPDADGKVNAGAVQAVAGPHASARLYFDAPAYVDGCLVSPNRWVYSEMWPIQYKVRPVVPEGKTFYSYYHTKVTSDADIKHVYPLTNGVVYIVPPPVTDATSQTLEAKYAAAEIWVDPSSAGSDENGDGSAQAPYKTLQKAVDSSVDYTIIHARRGDYDAGGRAVSNLLSRVDFTGDTMLHVLLRAEEGPDVTAIVGASDSSTLSDSGEPGCGANAARCVRMARYNAIQGFTLKGGRTLDRNSESVSGGSSTSDLVKDGAAVYGGVINDYESGQILDCVVTNCIGVNSIMHNVHMSRCRIVGCTAREFVVNKGSCVSSVVQGNICRGYFSSGHSYMSTYVGNSKHPAWTEFINWSKDKGACPRYSVFVGGNVGRKSPNDYGNYVWNQVATDNLSENSTEADPLLVDIANGDLRPFAFSPVVHGADPVGTFYKYVTSDFNGGPLAISADGRLSVGAFHNSLPSAYMLTATDGTSVTNALEIGSTGTLTFPANREGVTNPWWKGAVDLYEGDLEIAWGAKGSPCSFAATVSGEGTLTATLDGDALGSAVAADGTKTFEFMNDGQAVRTLKLSFAGRSSVRLSDFCNHMGFIMVVR